MTLDEDTSLLEETSTSRGPKAHSSRGLTGLFASTAFLGAGLLFVVQPLVAKLLLPSYGGSATVWSTSSLFFQVLLLAAYWYVHWSTTAFGSRWQPRLHLPLLLVPLLALPVALPNHAAPEAGTSPALWLLRTLILMIGLPFAVVATTGPVLQRWYSWSNSHRAEDPYFLFAASNLGSFGGLLAYPLVIEPNMSLVDQRDWWSGGFVVFALLAGSCAVAAARGAGRTRAHIRGADDKSEQYPLGRGRILRWIGLAFLPSSLMLGVTAHLSTDVAAIPMLWVVPLAIYLATFVLAFNRTSRTVPVLITRGAIAAGFVAIVTSLSNGAVPIAALIAVNLVMLALVGYAAHARLAADRPPVERLTTYYLVIALGGALGGLLNGLIAPTAFDWVLEYPLALAALPLLMLGLGRDRSSWLLRQVQANQVRAAIVVLAVSVGALGLRLAVWFESGHELLVAVLVAVVFLCGWWASQHAAVMLAAVLVIYGVATVQGTQDTLERTRTFFGSYTVKVGDDRHQLVHGTTVHGTQFWDESRRRTPTTYYSRQGPLGDVFGYLDEDRRFDNVAAIGLGTGTVAAYGRPGQSMTFFEIDAGMVEIARDPRLFTYLGDSEARVKTVVGDGRLRVAESPPSSLRPHDPGRLQL